MRIAITNPTNWPLVRRGAERFINELAAWMAARGHEVVVISAHPGQSTRTFENGYTTVMRRRLWRPWMERHGILEFHMFFFTIFSVLSRSRSDAVLACTFMDTFAACLLRAVTGVKVAFWVNSLPPKISYFRSRSMKGLVFKKAIRSADEVVALSRYMEFNLQSRYGRGGVTIPAPVNVNHFKLVESRDHSQVVILCTAALDDRRKGGKLLLRAMNGVKSVHPNAILRISCRLTDEARRGLLSFLEPQWHSDVEFLGPGLLSELPALMGAATVTVLASRWEAFGMVVLESLATGTPVAATRDGALPEILNDERVGRLFDPGLETEPEPTNVEALTEAICACVELSRDPETPARCRRHAERYGWDVVGPKIESVLLGMVQAENRVSMD